MTTESVYREVVAPERLVAEEPAAGNWHEGAVNTLALTDLGDGRTQMTCTSPSRRPPRVEPRSRAG